MKSEKVTDTCLTCMFRVSRDFVYTTKSYCEKQHAGRTKLRMKRIRTTDPACNQYKEGKKNKIGMNENHKQTSILELQQKEQELLLQLEQTRNTLRELYVKLFTERYNVKIGDEVFVVYTETTSRIGVLTGFDYSNGQVDTGRPLIKFYNSDNTLQEHAVVAFKHVRLKPVFRNDLTTKVK